MAKEAPIKPEYPTGKLDLGLCEADTTPAKAIARIRLIQPFNPRRLIQPHAKPADRVSV